MHLPSLKLIVPVDGQVQPENVELVRRDYVANGGWETFLAYEDPEQDILVSFWLLGSLAGSK